MEEKINYQGTQTELNLMKAFEAESKASMRYRLFAEESEEEVIEHMFTDIARNEQEHAEEILEELGGIGDTIENLKKSIALESFESVVDYPEMALIAREEGFPDIAKKFDILAKIEANHKIRFEAVLKDLEAGTLYKKPQKQLWECAKCGYIVEEFEPPMECPFCGHSREHFKIKNINY